MWLCTTKGFFSVVEDRKDSSRVMVRARTRNDAEAFLNLLLGDLPKGRTADFSGVIETPAADYRFRIIVPKLKASRIIAGLVLGIDYSNFKDRIHVLEDQEEKLPAYSGLWASLLNIQERERDHDRAANKKNPHASIGVATTQKKGRIPF